jgi:hypothetical protein
MAMAVGLDLTLLPLVARISCHKPCHTVSGRTLVIVYLPWFGHAWRPVQLSDVVALVGDRPLVGTQARQATGFHGTVPVAGVNDMQLITKPLLAEPALQGRAAYRSDTVRVHATHRGCFPVWSPPDHTSPAER